MVGRRPEAAAGAPGWMVTYGDCMGLLLCFFIILVSMSEIKENERFHDVMQSLRKAFGGYEGSAETLPFKGVSANSLIDRLLEIETSEGHKKAEDNDGIDGGKLCMTNVRDGLQIVVNGRLTFDRFSATLKPEARELIAATAERLRGYKTKILVRGHATSEPLPQDSPYEDARDLSYERAKAVALELERNGVRRARIVPVAAGDNEPLVRQAYTDDRRALNRRVEILVTEDLIDDYAGSELSDHPKESSSNGT